MFREIYVKWATGRHTILTENKAYYKEPFGNQPGEGGVGVVHGFLLTLPTIKSTSFSRVYDTKHFFRQNFFNLDF